MKNDERLRAALEEARFEMEEGMHLHAYEILRDAVGEVVKMPDGLEQVARGFGDIRTRKERHEGSTGKCE